MRKRLNTTKREFKLLCWRLMSSNAPLQIIMFEGASYTSKHRNTKTTGFISRSGCGREQEDCFSWTYRRNQGSCSILVREDTKRVFVLAEGKTPCSRVSMTRCSARHSRHASWSIEKVEGELGVWCSRKNASLEYTNNWLTHNVKSSLRFSLVSDDLPGDYPFLSIPMRIVTTVQITEQAASSFLKARVFKNPVLDQQRSPFSKGTWWLTISSWLVSTCVHFNHSLD